MNELLNLWIVENLDELQGRHEINGSIHHTKVHSTMRGRDEA